MTRATNNPKPKRTFEASAFSVPAARLRPALHCSEDETSQPGEQEAGARGPSPEIKPGIILRLIQIVKEL